MVKWISVKPLLMQLYPVFVKLPHSLLKSMNQKTQAARDRWSKEAGRYIRAEDDLEDC
jgi:hypothetical protein